MSGCAGGWKRLGRTWDESRGRERFSPHHFLENRDSSGLYVIHC